ncbi:ABC transporter substrate-binding protein [Weissella paramesenteroides]|uniref:ABC transporter substrate-binding protein n=1 Tax=Weissella paramesenteroides TaxID=1249 RepID=UPI00112A6F69|nr:ABC transporter substrate-binding protein [Weissella paramesenteroides]MCM6765668.1 ABC transporter substrate-binding protein [Weissella paramesenteroides]MCM6767025.1 ABC transporter substrate-binding protein [Weissella paramesenteroides]MCM6771197.1 ABC transporter substrate-binding protein [Weissella paramesenteroides]MCM6779710.1 ABC transporter substrate-binding protein [Weissella paramesenteroides]MCM6781750.1 ABC transporter substrate-binding protein [Weissella paramesenteroides]
MADTGQRPKMRDNDISFFLNVLPNTIKATLNVAQLGKVTRLYDDNKKAEVQPLALSSDETPRARLIGVHVGKTKRSIIAVGDVVVVMFMDRSIANFDGSNKLFKLSANRLHDLNDSFIVEVY